MKIQIFREKGLKISWSKTARITEETIPLKSLFVLSRYLEPRRSYNNSKFSWYLRRGDEGEWMKPRPTFFSRNRVLRFSRNRVWRSSAVRDGSASETSERDDEDEDSKRLKITLLFIRRYLGNRKSYRDNSKSVLKGKLPRFQRSPVELMKLINLEVTTV